MSMWLNRTEGQGARNATTTHTLTFTPASAGSLLVAVAGASALITWPVGWTERLQPAGNTELSIATKTATAGESTVTITLSAANYPAVWVVYEFSSGSAWSTGTGTANVTAFPNQTGLPGTAVSVFGASAYPQSSFFTAPISITASAPWIEDVDSNLGWINGQTDGVHLAVVYQDGVTATSAQPIATYTNTAGSGGERATFAINAAAPLAAPSVDALGDRYLYLGATLDRTAIVGANGATVTAQEWSLISGTGSPASLSSSAVLSWTPPSLGTYGLRFSATNSQGTTTQDITVTVVDGVWHKDAMIDMYRMGRF